MCMPHRTALAALALTLATASVAQDTKPQKPVDPVAEREALRMKDVEAWKKLQVKSLDQVLDVKQATKPLELPASVTPEELATMNDLLQKARDGGGGARTGRALREFEKMGHPALCFLVNQLREVNYKDPTDAMFGMQLNMTLQNITLGVNTGYVAIDPGEPMDPRKAQWNAMTVAEWQKAVTTFWPTKEKFEQFVRERKAKRDAELNPEGKDAPRDPPKDGGGKDRV